MGEGWEGLLGSCAAGTRVAAAASSWVGRWVGRAASQGMIGGGIAGAPEARKCPARAVNEGSHYRGILPSVCEHSTCDKLQSSEGESSPLVLWDARVVGERKLAEEGSLVFAAMSGSGFRSHECIKRKLPIIPFKEEANQRLLTYCNYNNRATVILVLQLLPQEVSYQLQKRLQTPALVHKVQDSSLNLIALSFTPSPETFGRA